MKIAQELYDGLNLGVELGGVQGLITYMRTDSTRISSDARNETIKYIRKKYGDKFIPQEITVYKNSKAQDAHEAIRPSNVALSPDLLKNVLTSDQHKLYKLIWERFVASQMVCAVIDQVSTDIENNGYVFKNIVKYLKSPGYLTVYNHDEEEHSEDSEFENCGKFTMVSEGEVLMGSAIRESRHFTEPPSRYTEASLIKFMEENGIGRPSTYAPIISLIISRDYVRRDGKSLVGTQLGENITDFMKKYFPKIVDYEFTAMMESSLDSIANNDNTATSVLQTFYGDFSATVEKAESESSIKSDNKHMEYTGQTCPVCSKLMIYKNGRYGKFIACSDYPECKSSFALDANGLPIDKKKDDKTITSGYKCEICGGELVVRSGKFGEFYACIDFPRCRFTKNKFEKTGVSCPYCGKEILAKRLSPKSVVYNCTGYPDCKFSSWDEPLKEICPSCRGMLFLKKLSGKVVCKNSGCNFKREESEN